MKPILTRRPTFENQNTSNNSKWNSKSIYVLPILPSVSLKLQGMLHDRVRLNGATIAKTAKDADFLIADEGVKEESIQKHLSTAIPFERLIKRCWIDVMIKSNEFVDPSKYLWKEPSVSTDVVKASHVDIFSDENIPLDSARWIPPNFPDAFKRQALALLALCHHKQSPMKRLRLDSSHQ